MSEEDLLIELKQTEAKYKKQLATVTKEKDELLADIADLELIERYVRASWKAGLLANPMGDKLIDVLARRKAATDAALSGKEVQL